MSEGIRIDSIPDLVKRVKDEWAKKEKEASARKKELEENMRGALRKEKELKEKLKKANSVVSKMEDEFQALESKILKEKEKSIKKGIPLEADVKEGKISLKEFQAKGKREADIQKEAVEQTQKELSQSLEAIRKKRLEIMNIEHELIKTQHRVRQLLLQPGMILKETLEKLKEFADREMSIFFEDYHSTRSDLQQMEHRLQLTTGKALTSGYRWDRMPVKEARKIQFDPILPQGLVPSFLEQLSKFNEDDQVTVVLTLRPLSVDVSSFGTHRISSDRVKIME